MEASTLKWGIVSIRGIIEYESNGSCEYYRKGKIHPYEMQKLLQIKRKIFRNVFMVYRLE